MVHAADTHLSYGNYGEGDACAVEGAAADGGVVIRLAPMTTTFLEQRD